MAAPPLTTCAPARLPPRPSARPSRRRRPSPPRPSRAASASAAAAAAAATSAPSASPPSSPPRVVLHDRRAALTPYACAWAWQRAACAELGAAAAAAADGGGAPAEAAGAPAGGPPAPLDSLALVQHPPTYTLGTGSTLEHVRFDPSAPPHGAAVYRVERGGEVTYHGPGQLVLYPVLDLRRYERDLHWYMRQLEEVVIRALRDGAGIADARRVDGLTGVWVGDAKVAACGVRVRRWVAFHGVALNVAPDMRHFEDIVPCGIGDRPVCSVEGVLAARGAAAGGASPTEGDALRDALADALLRAFEEVFGAELVGADAAAAAAFDGADAEGAAREGAVAARGARASAGGG